MIAARRMITNKSKQRFYATLFFFGASILLMRTVVLLSHGALEMFVAWVGGLLLAELILDVGWIFGASHWWISYSKNNALFTLRLAAAAIILHAIRVLIFVMGRLGPWIDFDRKPEYRPWQYSEWEWLYFAGIMSVLGIIGVIVVWRMRHRQKKSNR